MHFIDTALYNLVSGWVHKKPLLLTIDAHYWPCTKIFDHPTGTIDVLTYIARKYKNIT